MTFLKNLSMGLIREKLFFAWEPCMERSVRQAAELYATFPIQVDIKPASGHSWLVN